MDEKRDEVVGDEQDDRSYEPPAVSELGRVDASTGQDGGSSIDTSSDG